ncbi:unnamed protein product, partial [Meganyctiphanes norvegica]
MSYVGMSQHIDFDNLPDPNERFELLEVIGEGTYGEVFKAKDHESERHVAIKILENISENLEEIEEEYLVLKDLSLHPNIPMFFGIYLKRGNKQEEDQAWLAMELCPFGSVTDLAQSLIRRGQKLTEVQIAYILKETIDAMVYLHKNHCMHRDIKGHNILITENGSIKVVDFGVSSHLSSTWARRNTSVGTPYWMAPEVIACEQQLDYSYDIRSDVWSLGITAIELADGEPPLSEVHPMRALFQIPRNPPPTVERPIDWTFGFNDFVSECLVKDFEARPSAKDIQQHPFMSIVPHNPEEVRRGIVMLLEDLKKKQHLVKKAPETTKKGGALKPDRKTKRTPLWLDDLASLENLTEQVFVLMTQIVERYNIYDVTCSCRTMPMSDDKIKMGLYSGKKCPVISEITREISPPACLVLPEFTYPEIIHTDTTNCIIIASQGSMGGQNAIAGPKGQPKVVGQAPNRNLEDKILQINYIMEAFGNAKTGINDNSSRFGKYLELTFTKLGKVTGAKVSVYLLEQSRVVFQGEGEESFHIFYYLHDWLEAEDKLQIYCLDKSKRDKHRYLRGANWSKERSQSNVEHFKNVEGGFKHLGFKDEELDSIYRILSAIINLGDLDFYETTDKDNQEQAAVKNVEVIKLVSELLGVDANDLTESLTSNSVVTKGEIITRNNTVLEATETRDAMAKAMYGRLFDWIVNNINRLLSFARMVYGSHLSAGLLDIFGFENFKDNSFEQLCINIANEQIQYFFNQHIFTWEQQEYMAEGIEVSIIKFADNRPVLDLFLAKPMGLLALLDEESRFPKANDQTLVSKFHDNIKSKYYNKPKGDGLNFTIQHFAGAVTYTGQHFLDKNKNFLPTEVIHLLRQSSHDVIRFLFQCPLTKTGNLYYATPRTSPGATLRKNKGDSDKGSIKGTYDSKGLASQTKAQQTVATYFRYSLMDLLQKMVNGTPHFIRCVKPNENKRANNFDRDKVKIQLKYAGVMETVRIRQHGFSHRIPFAEFLRRYCFLAFNFDERVTASKENCRLLLIRLKMDGWALGKTKVFLKYYHVEYLAKVYEKQIRRVIQVQSCVRRWLAKIKVDKEKWKIAQSILVLQKYARGWKARKQYKKTIEKNVANKAVKAPPPKKAAAPKPAAPKPAAPKPAAAKKKEEPNPVKKAKDMNQEEAAIVIQSYYRGMHARQEYGPELEARLNRLVETHCDNADEAAKALQAEGLSEEEAAGVIQKYWGKHQQMKLMKKKNAEKQSNKPKDNKCKSGTNSKRMTALIMFSQTLHMGNQEVHKYLRKQKPGIRLEEVTKPPSSYTRPEGFDKVPQMLEEQRKRGPAPPAQSRPNIKVTSADIRVSSYYDALQDELRGDSPELKPDTPWDAPMSQKAVPTRPMKSQAPQPVKVDLRQEKTSKIQQGLRSQNMITKDLISKSETTNMQAAGDLRKMLRNPKGDAPKPPRPHSPTGRRSPFGPGGGNDPGPFDFKKMLRKTNYAPTDTIRKRREGHLRDNINGYDAQYQF